MRTTRNRLMRLFFSRTGRFTVLMSVTRAAMFGGRFRVDLARSLVTGGSLAEGGELARAAQRPAGRDRHDCRKDRCPEPHERSPPCGESNTSSGEYRHGGALKISKTHSTGISLCAAAHLMSVRSVPVSDRMTTPAKAPPKISQVELTRNRTSKNAFTAVNAHETASINAAGTSWTVTTTINASEATFTPSRNAPKVGERRNRETNGALMATKTNAGRNMPIVATAAPADPPRR